uniref:Membrane-associated protein n=1 Tax=Brugia timori TaxID=42155 RepID=A0A0R3Q931_9BILA
LAVLVLLSLASVPWLLINGLLWLIALAALSGSILAQLTYHIPSLRVVQTEYLYRYDFLMTICASVCVPISTYCTVYETEDDSSSTLYIALALLCILLATSFLLSLIIQYDFDSAYPFDALKHSVTDWMPTQPLNQMNVVLCSKLTSVVAVTIRHFDDIIKLTAALRKSEELLGSFASWCHTDSVTFRYIYLVQQWHLIQILS